MHNEFKTQKFKRLMLAMGPSDLNSAPYSPVHCSSHSMTSFQSSELTELPVVENSQLFAQRGHCARTAHGTPPKWLQSVILQCVQADPSEQGGHAGKRPLLRAVVRSNGMCLAIRDTLFRFLGYIGETRGKQLGDSGYNRGKNWGTSYLED